MFSNNNNIYCATKNLHIKRKFCRDFFIAATAAQVSYVAHSFLFYETEDKKSYDIWM